jgi:transcriptional regulator with GAF, ATPase, and Fis domain
MNDINQLTKLKFGIQLLYDQGLKEQALAMEKEAKAKGMNVGSWATEEELTKFITCDSEMLAMKDEIRILASNNYPVLIQGETGTGKELIAKALHGSRGPINNGPLVEGRFIGINCPAISVDLMESELFGHVKGAFTGAVSDKIGKFQAAYKGTLFIDEIGDMPASMQSAILRVLQEKVIVKVGSNEETPIDCRIVCATNKDLESMVSAGTFRLDLLERINVFELKTKPLRERAKDIELMIKAWDKTKKFPYAIDNLHLPGNVRTLQKYITRWNTLGKI